MCPVSNGNNQSNAAQRKKMKSTYSVDVLWSGCVGSIGTVALKGKVVFGAEQEQRYLLTTCLDREMRE